MKKCPNCGTILDDSKTSCYMCGASLNPSNKMDFGAAIDAAVGSTVTSGADNVFNNGEDIKVKGNDVISENNDGAFYGKNSDAFQVFGENINSLNNMKSIDPLEQQMELVKKQEEENQKKILEQQEQARREKKERMLIEAEQAKERQRLREEQNKKKKEEKLNKIKEKKQQKQLNDNQPKQVFVENIPKEKIKPSINWGNNLAKKNNIKESKTINISKSMIFNSLCVILFVCMLVFVYFKFLKEAPDNSLSIGGLKYTISDEFQLSSNDNNSRFYSYGDSCNLRIMYGTPDNSDSYIDNYFETQKESFVNNQKYHTVNESMSINDNKWEVMKVVEFVENPSSTSGVTEITKYRYVSIVYNNKYYNTIFVNLNNDSTCSAMYNNFVDSLSF